MSESGTVPAGWFPDPSGAPRQRYWDGVQWTEHYHPPINAAPDPAMRQPGTPPGQTIPPKRRRGKIIAIVAGSVALVVAATSFFVWGIPALTDGANGQVFSNPDWDYDYTNPMLNIERDHEFEFPANYDYDELAAANNGPADPDNPDYFPDNFAFEVYYDAAFTFRAQILVIQYDPNEPIHIMSRDAPSASPPDDSDSYDFIDIMDEGYGEWGLHSEYYLMRKIDENGDILAKPVVTKFTVKSELEAPTVTFGTEENNGKLTMEWEPVEGATEYYVVTSNTRTEGDASRGYSILGIVTEPSWSSVTSQEDPTLEIAPWVSRQNVGMKMFSGSSADDLAGGFIYENDTGEYDYGVIATNGTNYSPYVAYDAVSVASALPFEIAFTASRELKNWGPSGFIEGIENVQTSIRFTSLDGATRSTTAFIDPTRVVDYGDRWVLPLQGRGTLLGEWAPILKASVPDITAAVAQFNAAAEQASPPTGMPTFDVISAPVDELAEGVKEAPPTDYPIYGSNEFTRFLAQHFIAQTPVIDISDYANAPGMPEAFDAAQEAMYQNPYAINIDGLSLGGGGDKLFVTYLFDKGEAEAIQESIAAKSAEVIASVVSDDMSDAQIVTALNDWLVANSEYDDAALAALDQSFGSIPDGYEYAWNATGNLIDGKGVCASYAYAFNALANAAGVETVVVAGDVLSGGAHAWNKVFIDGAWKAVDVTWNDSPDGNRYLMINDSEFTDSAQRVQDEDWMYDLYLTRYATP